MTDDYVDLTTSPIAKKYYRVQLSPPITGEESKNPKICKASGKVWKGASKVGANQRRGYCSHRPGKGSKQATEEEIAEMIKRGDDIYGIQKIYKGPRTPADSTGREYTRKKTEDFSVKEFLEEYNKRRSRASDRKVTNIEASDAKTSGAKTSDAKTSGRGEKVTDGAGKESDKSVVARRRSANDINRVERESKTPARPDTRTERTMKEVLRIQDKPQRSVRESKGLERYSTTMSSKTASRNVKPNVQAQTQAKAFPIQSAFPLDVQEANALLSSYDDVYDDYHSRKYRNRNRHINSDEDEDEDEDEGSDDDENDQDEEQNEEDNEEDDGDYEGDIASDEEENEDEDEDNDY